MSLAYAMEQRLRFIDFLLFHYGHVAPRQLVDYFGISKPCASLDFAKYAELHPGNMEYVYTTLRWEKTKEFQRAYS
jgi:hypothetical protein